jgi:hypothetical protein
VIAYRFGEAVTGSGAQRPAVADAAVRISPPGTEVVLFKERTLVVRVARALVAAMTPRTRIVRRDH